MSNDLDKYRDDLNKISAEIPLSIFAMSHEIGISYLTLRGFLRGNIIRTYTVRKIKAYIQATKEKHGIN